MVQLETVTGDKMCGVVRYCGEWPGHTNNGPTHARWCGVELEEEIRGGGHGWVQVRHAHRGGLCSCEHSLAISPDSAVRVYKSQTETN